MKSSSATAINSLTREQKELLVQAIREKNRRRAAQPNAKGCLFFIDTYLKTFDPRPDVEAHDLDFTLYDYQKEYVEDLVKGIQEGKDLFVEKSRDMGVSWVTLAVLLWAWMFLDGFQGLVGSRKEDYVDNKQVDSLFGKFDYLLEHIKDRDLIPKGFDDRKHRLFMKLINPRNGNTIQGESANKNFSRAGRYSIVFFDEFGFWPDARRSWTAAGDATKCRVAVTTPPDEPSFAKTVRFSDKIKLLTYHWSIHPKKDQEWYEYEKSRRTEEEVLHELDISWEYSGTTRPYPEVDSIPLGRYAYDSSLPLYVSLDLGLDGVAIGWYQPVRNSDWITLVEAYENNDKVIEWFLPFFGKPIDSRFQYTDSDLKLIEQVKYWQSGIFYGDPSGKQRHVESGVSPYNILQDYGIFVQTNEKENDWVARRDAAKRILMKLRVNDTERTQWWINCVKNARYPKRDAETAQNVNPIPKPVHDWTSHHRTQTEYFAVNYRTYKEPEIEKKQEFDPVTGRMLS